MSRATSGREQELGDAPVGVSALIGQPEAAARQLPLEDSVLRHEVLNDVLLVAIDPSGEGHEQYLQGVEVGSHGPILPALGNE